MSAYPLTRVLIALLAAGKCALALAMGGFESTGRPSEHRPELPRFTPWTESKIVEPPIPSADTAGIDEDRRIPVRQILFEGNRAIPDQTIADIVTRFASSEGKDGTYSLSQLENLRREISQLYLDRGFLNSGAIIPEGEPRDGDLHLRIVEGRLDEVVVNGNERLREGYIRNRLSADANAVFNVKDLEERFQLLLADPLIAVMNGAIRPGVAPGHAILDVQVRRARPYGVSLFGDNFRPPSIGADAIGLNGWVRNLTGFGDALEFTFASSSGSKRYSGGWSVPINDAGTQAFFNFDIGNSKVIQVPFKSLDIESTVEIFEGGISHPLIDRLRQRLTIGTLFTTRSNESTLAGQPFSFVPGVTGGNTQVTAWRAYFDYLHRWDQQALAMRSTFTAGLNALGATITRGGNPSSEFFSWLGQAQYAYRLDDGGTQFVLRGNVQLANHALLPLERIAVGGYGTVRGYRTNYLVRDEGYTASGEFRLPLPPFDVFGIPSRVTLVPFMDFGAARDLGGKSDALWSVGAGITWQYSGLFAEVFYGHPLNRPKFKEASLQDDGLFFQVRLDAMELI